MAIKSKATLKTYFETGDFPTESQFADLIDSLRHEDEEVPLNEVTGLLDILNQLGGGAVGLLSDLKLTVGGPGGFDPPVGATTVTLPPEYAGLRIRVYSGGPDAYMLWAGWTRTTGGFTTTAPMYSGQSLVIQNY